MRAIDFEEIKEDMDSNYASNMYDRSDYDVLEGQNVDDALRDIMANQQRILANDAENMAAA